jgi:hypothetical protein
VYVPEPVFDAAERFMVVCRIEQHEHQIGIVEEERVNQPVVWLPGEVPQNSRAVHSDILHLSARVVVAAVDRRI